MDLGQRLQACRKELDWTQTQIATALRVPRELVSMWEGGSRKPSLKKLEELARLFRVDVAYLLGDVSSKQCPKEQQLLYRGLERDEPVVRAAIENWLRFLGEWADLVSDESDFEKPRFPKRLDRGPSFCDTRQASTAARQVREEFNLGLFALPDLYAFLDEQQILVCQAKLGTIGDGTKSISGVFYDHPTLGYCLLVNSQTSPGRQCFTLAHEMAHALYHYGVAESIISRQGEDAPYEHFANAFARHFLVPTMGLNQFLEDMDWKQDLDPNKALLLAHFFRVSYAFMLIRLEQEGHLRAEQKREWQELSPSSMARRLGLDPSAFEPQASREPDLNRYPTSVLGRVKHYIEADMLSEAQAADLLDVSLMSIRTSLLAAPSKAREDERKEMAEFATA